MYRNVLGEAVDKDTNERKLDETSVGEVKERLSEMSEEENSLPRGKILFTVNPRHYIDPWRLPD